VRVEYEGDPGNPRITRRELRWGDPTDPIQACSPGGVVAYGRIQAIVEYGEVDAFDCSFQDVDADDTRSTSVDYTLPNEALWIVDRIAARTTRAGPSSTGGWERRTEFEYDEGADPPVVGDLTKRVRVLEGSSPAVDPTTTLEYDAYGNVVRAHDARANSGETMGPTLEIRWDDTFHAFPVEMENALGHLTRVEYAAPAECSGVAGAVDHPAGLGKAHLRWDPNGSPALGNPVDAMLRCYDAFARPVLEVGPAGLYETDWAYATIEATPGVAVGLEVTERRLASAGVYRSSTLETDGFTRGVRSTEDGAGGRTIVVERTIDALGRLGGDTLPHFLGDPAPIRSVFYDALDRVTRVDLPSPLGGTSSFVSIHAPGGVHGLVEESDPNGVTRQTLRDVFGRAVEVQEIEGTATHTTVYDYDVLGQLAQVTDSELNETHVHFDVLGRRDRLIDPDAGEIDFDWDVNGNLASRCLLVGGVCSEPVTWVYDDLDRPVARRISGVDEVTWAYDDGTNGLGLLYGRGDASGAYAATEYDLLGRVTAEGYQRAGKNHAFTNTYGLLGQLATRKYPNGTIVSWVRDARGFLTGIESGAGEYATAIDWDAQGRLVAWTAGNGVETRVDLDPDTSLIEGIRVGPPGSELADLSYQLDAGFRVEHIVDELDPARNRSFVYDDLGRLSTATGPYDPGLAPATLEYGYDPIGNMTCMAASDVNGCVGGRTAVFPAPGPGVARPHAPIAIDGVPTGYDDAGNLTSVGNRAYTYDVHGELERVEEAGATLATFEYDASGRLAQIDVPGAGAPRYLMTEDFEWDAALGLARIHVLLDGQTIATDERSYNGSPPSGGGCSSLAPALALDGPEGPLGLLFLLLPGVWLVVRPAALRLRAEGRLGRAGMAVATSGAFLAFVSTPAPFGRLGGGEAWAASPAGVVYYHRDHLGSSVVLTDAQGLELERHHYRPFGDLVPGGPAAPPEFGFTGQRFEPTVGLYDYGARWYDPSVGRFLQPDVLVSAPQLPQTLNRYAYVANDPINFKDPTGEFAILAFAMAVMIAIMFAAPAAEVPATPPPEFQDAKNQAANVVSMIVAFEQLRMFEDVGRQVEHAFKAIDAGRRLSLQVAEAVDIFERRGARGTPSAAKEDALPTDPDVRRDVRPFTEEEIKDLRRDLGKLTDPELTQRLEHLRTVCNRSA